MSFIAILGAGPIGGALAHRLAARGRVRDIRLIDDERGIAAGKALDILQSAPIEGWSTRVSATDALEAAAGADAIVIADAARDGAEHTGDPALAVLRRLARIESSSLLVFAGAHQRDLMQRTISEGRVATQRVVGTAPAALESAIRALAALELDRTGADVQLIVAGVPPHAALVAWEGATASGQPLGGLIPPHRLSAISASLPGLWPPGPTALASAASRVAEAASCGSRRRYTCFAPIATPSGGGGAVVALPVEISRPGIVRLRAPALSRQEQTQLDNAIAGVS